MYTVHRVARMWSVDDEASDRIGRIQPMGRCTYVIAAVGSCQPLICDEWASDDAIASVTNLQWPGFESWTPCSKRQEREGSETTDDDDTRLRCVYSQKSRHLSDLTTVESLNLGRNFRQQNIFLGA